MTTLSIRPIGIEDRSGVKQLLYEAFNGPDEARLTEDLRAGGDIVLELGAFQADRLVGVVVFSRLTVTTPDEPFAAVALAPVATRADLRRAGIATHLIETAHHQLREAGEKLSVVLGDPEFYVRFGYDADRAKGFSSPWQGPFLQALAWEAAPMDGQLRYARAFERL